MFRANSQWFLYHYMNPSRRADLDGTQMTVNRIESHDTFRLGLLDHCNQIIVHHAHIESISIRKCPHSFFIGFGNPDNLNIGTLLISVQKTMDVIMRQTVDSYSNRFVWLRVAESRAKRTNKTNQ